MRRVGEVVRTAQGLAVVRCGTDEYPDVGTELVDENLDGIGAVVDVFGPTERPYLAVDPDDGRQVAALLGTAVYAR